MIVGAIFGAALPILLPDVQNFLILPLMLICGIIGGMAYGFIPALLKAKFKTNEILTSLMLVYVAQMLLDWIVRGPWRNPEGLNFPESRRFHEWARLPEMFPADGRANWGFVIAVVVAIALGIMLAKSLKGFEVKVIGTSPKAAQFAGFNTKKMIFFAFLLAGGCAGLAGIIEVAGATGQLRPTVSPRLWLYCHYCGLFGPLEPYWRHRSRSCARAHLFGW